MECHGLKYNALCDMKGHVKNEQTEGCNIPMGRSKSVFHLGQDQANQSDK